MKQSLVVFCCVSLALLSGCNEERKARTAARKAALNELLEFHSKPLSELKCENIDYRYERCNEYRYFECVEHCRDGYAPVIARCYGVVKQ